jgi:hypothetical protein
MEVVDGYKLVRLFAPAVKKEGGRWSKQKNFIFEVMIY